MSDQQAELEKTKGVANVGLRRQWDKDEYRKKAMEREESRRQPAIKRKFERDEQGNLTSVPLLTGRAGTGSITRTLENDVGKSKMVNPEGKGADKGGYWCEHCQVCLRLSILILINFLRLHSLSVEAFKICVVSFRFS